VGYNVEVHAIISQKTELQEPHILFNKTGFIFYKNFIDKIGEGGCSSSNGSADKCKEANYSIMMVSIKLRNRLFMQYCWHN
jgi:hypothetical protein